MSVFEVKVLSSIRASSLFCRNSAMAGYGRGDLLCLSLLIGGFRTYDASVR